jgi:hypothetical protein
VLEAHRPALRALAEALLERETLDGEEAEAIVRAATEGAPATSRTAAAPAEAVAAAA